MDNSEDALNSPAKKQRLLNNFSPSHESNRSDHDGDSSEDMIQMFGNDSDDDSETEEEPTKKRRRLNSNITSNTTNTNRALSSSLSSSTTRIISSFARNGNDTTKQKEGNNNDTEARLQEAKRKLSKWSQRLFDPARPRGLIETPTVIPLNDEFLKNFGKREKEMDKAIGRDITHIDVDIDVDIDVETDGQTDTTDITNKSTKNTKDVSSTNDHGAKVKIANLAYSTTKEKITRTCERYGPVMSVTLLMDEENQNLSKGRGYVIFESVDHREAFIEGMNGKPLDGRILRLFAVNEEEEAANNKRKNQSNSTNGGGLARYWEKDITTKCFRCGQIGHMAGQCPNEELARPCPICAKKGHDSYSCPLHKICFNCGIPGHVNRDCKEKRGQPRRLACGKCFISGHHRWDCVERAQDIPSYNAICFVCGGVGHFMCKPMKWLHGLKGMTCFNCGDSNHHGSQCNRPLVDNCAKNGEVVLQEIERAESMTFMQELEDQKRNSRNNRNSSSSRKSNSSSSRSRGKSHGSHDRGRQRERDNYHHQQQQQQQQQQPPPPPPPPPQQQRFSFDIQTSNYGRIEVGNHHRSHDNQRQNNYGRRK